MPERELLIQLSTKDAASSEWIAFDPDDGTLSIDASSESLARLSKSEALALAQALSQYAGAHGSEPAFVLDHPNKPIPFSEWVNRPSVVQYTYVGAGPGGFIHYVKRDDKT